MCEKYVSQRHFLCVFLPYHSCNIEVKVSWTSEKTEKPTSLLSHPFMQFIISSFGYKTTKTKHLGLELMTIWQKQSLAYLAGCYTLISFIIWVKHLSKVSNGAPHRGLATIYSCSTTLWLFSRHTEVLMVPATADFIFWVVWNGLLLTILVWRWNTVDIKTGHVSHISIRIAR